MDNIERLLVDLKESLERDIERFRSAMDARFDAIDAVRRPGRPQRTVVIMLDGFGTDYWKLSPIPVLRGWGSRVSAQPSRVTVILHSPI